MATGDVSVVIEPDGWSALLTVQGFTSGATYSFGLAGNNIPGATTPYIIATSCGFTNAGVATTQARQVFVTSTIRFPFSTQATAGSYTSGTFADGETVIQGVSLATGIVVGNQSTGALLIIRNVTGTPDSTAAHTWVGQTSAAIFAPTATPTVLAQPTNDEKVPTGPNLTVRVALSDYIFQKDNTGGGNSGTAPTFTAPAGFIVNTAGAGQSSNIATAIAVTNNSTAAYPNVVGNWSWPGVSTVTGNFPLSIVCFHGTSVVNNGVQVSPGTCNIACVVATVTDTSSNTATTTVTAPVYDSTVGDACPVVEFKPVINVSGLTQGNILTCNFKAYPLVGDTAAILDTTVGGTAAPTPLYGPITMVNDKASTYGQSFCTVDPVNGVDLNGVVYATSALAVTNAAAHSYLTMAAAYNALRTYNDTGTFFTARNNCGNSTMYLRTGNNPFVNGAVTVGTAPDTWLTLAGFPGDAQSGIFITGQVTGKSLGLKLKVTGVTINSNDAGGTFSPGGVSWLWIDKCICASNTGITPYQNKVWYITRSTFTGSAQWFVPNSTENWCPGIIRGNTITFTTEACLIRCWMTIGNLKTGNTTANIFALLRSAAGSTAPSCDNGVVAFNQFYGLDVNIDAIMAWGEDCTISSGFAVVQNIFENYFYSPSAPLAQIAGDDATTVTDPNNNIIVWNNTSVGQRENIAYNDNGDSGAVRKFWSEKNNVFYDYNIKTDTFTKEPATITNSTTTATLTYPAHNFQAGDCLNVSGATPAAYNVANVAISSVTTNTIVYTMASNPGGNASVTGGFNAYGGRIGNWPMVNGVNLSGNLYGKGITGLSFLPDFLGIQSFQNNWNGVGPVTYYAFVNFAAANSTTASNGAGGGNYLPTASSPFLGLQREQVLPYDSAGALRGPTSAAGAFQFPPQSNMPGGVEATGLGSGAGVGLKYGLGNSGLGRWWGI